MPGSSTELQSDSQRFSTMEGILGGLAAAAVAGTIAYSSWTGGVGAIVARLYVFAFYLPPPYLALWILAPAEETGAVALTDRICATLTALGLLAVWGWYVTVPLTPQNAQAPIGLFMIGWNGAAGLYGTFKILVHVLRWRHDR